MHSYSYATQEAQTRRLADFAFMIRDYRLATSMYDLVRKDFMNDKAWLHYAAASVSVRSGATGLVTFTNRDAQRLAGLSQLMISTQSSLPLSKDINSYLEQALSVTNTLVNGSAKLDDLKAAVLYQQGFEAIGGFRFITTLFTRVAGEVRRASVMCRIVGQ
jgi:trafficking protein particle complex subunit 8